ncbi:TetR/AcrR family transcriptional regulator [Anaerospora hongkongensis]|uniref:TetR/AcrR family transcriptional regulator n=1 Tax=Anaerospora hongkongensis TaxID=244830 RepID=UPI00289E2C38|nr:TetR/AcrR family transcriptional regulator [Anaerospora hongkongensis]
MARTPQDPQIRITEILDTAEQLFSDKGYRGTTISDIAKTMGTAQGMLYYYFKSKEDILEALINRHAASILSEAKDIAYSETIAPPRKIELMVYTGLRGVQYKDGLFLDLLHDEQQLHIKYRISRHCNLSLTPWLLNVIAEGIEKDYFHVPHPQTALDFILLMLDFLIVSLPEKMPAELLALRLKMAGTLIEKTLGAQEGTIQISM